MVNLVMKGVILKFVPKIADGHLSLSTFDL